MRKIIFGLIFLSMAMFSYGQDNILFLDDIKIGMSIDDILDIKFPDEQGIEKMELKTIVHILGTIERVEEKYVLIALPEYFFYEKKLTGISYIIYDDFPIYYGQEERNDYETNKELYNYLKISVTKKYGIGTEIDNKKPYDDEIKELSPFVLNITDEERIENISITYWKINDGTLYLTLVLYKNGISRKTFIYGSDFLFGEYGEILKMEIFEKYGR
jgi:hypothetical protein